MYQIIVDTVITAENDFTEQNEQLKVDDRIFRLNLSIL